MINEKKGFTLIELLVVIAIIALLVAILLPALSLVIEKSKQTKCKANLDQMGKSLHLYQQDYGDNRQYPNANGAGFLVRLYKVSVLSEYKVFICPSTTDTNNNGQDFEFITGEETTTNACSYAGRKNQNQLVYPGIYTTAANVTTTPVAADDIEQPADTWNHPNIMNFLFLDGHVENVNQRIADFDLFLDPLTN